MDMDVSTLIKQTINKWRGFLRVTEHHSILIRVNTLIASIALYEASIKPDYRRMY